MELKAEFVVSLGAALRMVRLFYRSRCVAQRIEM